MQKKLKSKVRLEGQVSKVIYYDDSRDQPFSIFTLITSDGSETVKVKAEGLKDPYKGLRLRIDGKWEEDKDGTPICKTDSAIEFIPLSNEGIIEWVRNGALGFISASESKTLADNMEASGVDWITYFAKQEVTPVDGISSSYLTSLKEAWFQYRAVLDISNLINEYQVPEKYAKDVYSCITVKRGWTVDETMTNIRKNPYILSYVPGISFLKIDSVVSKQVGDGFVGRVYAGMQYVLNKAIDKGDTCIDKEQLIKESSDILNITTKSLEQFFMKFTQNKVKDSEFRSYFMHSREFVTHRSLDMREEVISKFVNQLLSQSVPVVHWKQPSAFQLDPSQKQALDIMARSPISLLIGGPGRGKTTMVKTIAEAAEESGYELIMCAPTGRAAQRLYESTGIESYTIHRLMGLMQDEKVMSHPKLWIFMDESSMLDTDLASSFFIKLIKHSPPNCELRMTLIGDKDQLPPIQPGMVLRDLMRSEVVPTAELTFMHRAQHGSGVHSLGDDIIHGKIQPVSDYEGVQFCSIRGVSTHGTSIAESVADYIFQHYKDSHEDLQVLCPLNEGDLGVRSLNKHLREKFNPSNDSEDSPHKFRVGDKVIQTDNDYNLRVFNGEMGRITGIIQEKVIVRFEDNRVVAYEKEDIKKLDLAYCISIHKSQGSQFGSVVLVIPKSSLFVNLNMVYTGVTRAKNGVHIISEESIWKMSCSTKQRDRVTTLAHRVEERYNKQHSEQACMTL